MESINTNHRPENLPNPNGKVSKNDIINGIEEPESLKNEFPIDVFPLLFKNLVVDLNQSLNFPIDYTAISILTAVATAVGTNVKLKVKTGWYEYPSFYSCIVGNAGTNKSHPVATIFKPLKEIDKEAHKNFKEAFTYYEGLGKEEKANMSLPILKKHVLTNFTPEILCKRLEQNPKGLAVLSDELITFFNSMNQYSKGDQATTYLSFWSNQSTTIDRVGNPVPLFIDTPCLSIIGGIQPRALKKAFPADKIDNGLFQRFLFCFPENVVKSPISDIERNEQLFERYRQFIARLEAIEEPRTLVFNPDANTLWREWQKANCDLVNDDEGIKSEIITKFDNHFLRLAIALQMMSNPDSTEIQIEAVEGAKRLCGYFIRNAFKVFDLIQDKDEYVNSLPKNKQDLYKRLNTEFLTAGAVQGGESLGMKELTVKRFLNDEMIFEKLSHGKYRKLIAESIPTNL